MIINNINNNNSNKNIKAHIEVQTFYTPHIVQQERAGNYSACLTDEQTSHSFFNGQQIMKKAMGTTKQIQAARRENNNNEQTNCSSCAR
eukprot:8087992-Heterocapsa_arctica.AAC.1